MKNGFRFSGWNLIRPGMINARSVTSVMMEKATSMTLLVFIPR